MNAAWIAATDALFVNELQRAHEDAGAQEPRPYTNGERAFLLAVAKLAMASAGQAAETVHIEIALRDAAIAALEARVQFLERKREARSEG